MINKRQAIRNVTRDDTSLSNTAIKRAVKTRYDLTIESNEITAVLGNYADRRFSGKSGQTQLILAAQYLRQMGGDIRQAVRLLHLCGSNQTGEEEAL